MKRQKSFIFVVLSLLVFTLLSSFGSGYVSTSGLIYNFTMNSNCNSVVGGTTINFDETDSPTFASGGADFEATDTNYCKYSTDFTLISALSDYTICLKYQPESLAATHYLWDERATDGIMVRVSDSTGYKYAVVHDGASAAAYYSTSTLTAGKNSSLCVIWSDASDKGTIFFNGVNQTPTATQYSPNNENTIGLGAQYDGGAVNTHADGNLYYFCVWNRILNNSEILDMNVSTSNCYGTVSGPPADITPPTITNVVRYPTNITVLNLANQHLLINATITDDIKLSKVNITMRLNKTAVYINGTQFNLNGTYRNTTNTGNVFKWDFDETYLLGATYPINFSIMETTDHKNLTLDNTNKMVKMKFFNVNNKIQNNFYEIYAENVTTGTTTYYYCNSSYTTGNPAVKSHCTAFYSSSTAIPFNHTHGGGKSKHRIVPMGINTTTGKIGSVLVTPESYIIKRVTSGSERVYYISNIARTSQSQYSSNLGNTWSDTLVGSTGTIDAHIHSNQIGASINYRVCAEDSSGNDACSSWYSDFTDSPSLPPTGVNFYKPIYDGTYNETLMINHTASVSPSGYTITNYTYLYAEENSTSFTQIGVSLSPTTTYSWDISAITNDRYYLKVIIRDSQRQSTTSYSDSFNIYNPPSLSEVLLQSIDTRLELIYDLLDEVLTMIPIILIYIAFMFLSWSMIKNNQIVPGGILWLLTLGFDLFIIGYLYDVTVALDGSTIYETLGTILQAFLGLWMVAKVAMLVSFRYKRPVKEV